MDARLFPLGLLLVVDPVWTCQLAWDNLFILFSSVTRHDAACHIRTASTGS